MAKKKEDKEVFYKFDPQRTLTLEECTEMFKKICGNWVMTQEQHDALHPDLKDVFLPVKE